MNGANTTHLPRQSLRLTDLPCASSSASFGTFRGCWRAVPTAIGAGMLAVLARPWSYWDVFTTEMTITNPASSTNRQVITICARFSVDGFTIDGQATNASLSQRPKRRKKLLL